jgi:hypothetical protein
MPPLYRVLEVGPGISFTVDVIVVAPKLGFSN